MVIRIIIIIIIILVEWCWRCEWFHQVRLHYLASQWIWRDRSAPTNENLSLSSKFILEMVAKSYIFSRIICLRCLRFRNQWQKWKQKMCTMFDTASRCLIPAVIPLAKNTGHCEEVHLAAKNGSRKMTWRNSTIWPRCSSPQGKIWNCGLALSRREKVKGSPGNIHLVQSWVASLLITIAAFLTMFISPIGYCPYNDILDSYWSISLPDGDCWWMLQNARLFQNQDKRLCSVSQLVAPTSPPDQTRRPPMSGLWKPDLSHDWYWYHWHSCCPIFFSKVGFWSELVPP